MEDKQKLSKFYKPIPLDLQDLGTKILDVAYEVHSVLGPAVETQVVVPVNYKEVFIATGLRLDVWVERKVVLELKTVEQMQPIYQAQLITYLKVTGCRLGYLMNFNVQHFKDGFKRMVH